MAFRLHWIDNYDPIFAAVNFSLIARQYTGSFRAMLARDGNVIHLDLGSGAMLDFLDAHPRVPGLGLRRRGGQIVVSDVFILAGEKAGVTSGASLDIYGKSISSHVIPPTF
jgi:hypothetical protein